MPAPCANGCPFFGTPQTDNLCSSCYRLAHPPATSSNPCCAVPSSLAATVSSAVAAGASASTPTSTPTSTSSSAATSTQTSTPSSIQPLLPVPSSSSPSPSPSEQQLQQQKQFEQQQQQQQQQQQAGETSILKIEEQQQQQTQGPQMVTVEDSTQQGKLTSTSTSTIAKNRCYVCRKKLGLTPFVCRCARSFCSLHRMPNVHACEFDFKAHHRNVLTRANPAVIAKKLDKI